MVTLARLERCCDKIAENVKTFRPDYIVSIESGGWYIGHLLEKKLQLPHYSITVKRSINLQKLYRIFPERLRIIPSIVQGLLFHCKDPMLQARLPTLTESALKGKNVLLVDDAVHSGKTFFVAIEYLQSIGVGCIKTATVSNVFDNPVVDYYCYSGMYFFPWSRPSYEYPTYLSLRKNLEDQTVIAL